MHVPRFWEKESAEVAVQAGKKFRAVCWGWSASSPEEARRRAAEWVQRLVQRLASGAELPGHYGYDERLPREEIIDEYSDDAGETMAIVTRNSHGSLILNTRDLMFIDVDVPVTRRPIALPVARAAVTIPVCQSGG